VDILDPSRPGRPDALSPCGRRHRDRDVMTVGLIGRKVGMTVAFQPTARGCCPVSEVAPNTSPGRTLEEGPLCRRSWAPTPKKLNKPRAASSRTSPRAPNRWNAREFRAHSLGLRGRPACGHRRHVRRGRPRRTACPGQGPGQTAPPLRSGPRPMAPDHHHEPGSIGPGTTPGRVWSPMAGPHGRRAVTRRRSGVGGRRRPEPAAVGAAAGTRGSLIRGRPDDGPDDFPANRAGDCGNVELAMSRRRAGQHRRAAPGCDGPSCGAGRARTTRSPAARLWRRRKPF
jgi:hypothetical protein